MKSPEKTAMAVRKKNGEIDNRFYFNGLLEEVSYKDYSGVDYVIKKSVKLVGAMQNAMQMLMNQLVTDTSLSNDEIKERAIKQTDHFLNTMQKIVNDNNVFNIIYMSFSLLKS